MPHHEVGAARSQLIIGVVVGIGDLTVCYPDHSVTGTTATERPLERRAVNAIAHIADGPAQGSPSAVSEEPSVWRSRDVTRSVAVADDGHTGHGLQKLLE